MIINYNHELEKGIIYGDKNLAIPSLLNYGKYVLDKFLKVKDRIALINGATGEQITFGEMSQQIVNTAASLARLGVKRGDVVAICSENRVEFMITTIAVLYAGGVVTFINSAYSNDEIIHTTNISRPKYVFLSPETYKKYYETFVNLGFICKYFVYGAIAEINAMCFTDLSTKHVAIDSFEPEKIDGQTQTAIIVYSSGTTGLPKGAKWTHVNLIIAALQPIPFNGSLVCLSIAPMSNTVGYICASDVLIEGNTVVLVQKFIERNYLQIIEKYRVNYIIAVPSLVVILCKSTMLKDFDVSSVEIIFCGGAPLDHRVITQIKNTFSNLKHVLQGYGMTEASGAISQETELENKQGSVGKVVPGIIFKVVDIETRQILGPNKTGEVCLKGPALFGGYIGKVSSDDYDDEGFYKSGDVAYYDSEGYIFIVDRLKELIKYKSWQVSPSELEAVLLQHLAVKDAGVFGIADSVAVEIPTAFVVKQQGSNATEKDIVDFIASKVSPWKQLRGGVRFVKEIPKNGSGKILRRKLREFIAKPPSKL